MRKLGLIEKEYELQEVAQNVASQMGFVGRVPWFCSGSVARITQKVGDDELSRVVRAHDSAKDRLDGEDKPARGVVGELKNDMIRMFEIEKKNSSYEFDKKLANADIRGKVAVIAYCQTICIEFLFFLICGVSKCFFNLRICGTVSIFAKTMRVVSAWRRSAAIRLTCARLRALECAA